MKHKTRNIKQKNNIQASGFKLQGSRGQVMILTVIILGGIILGATTIAGLLMIYQIRQSTNVKHSTMAVFAADTGVELCLYKYAQGVDFPCEFTLSLNNQATSTVSFAYDAEGNVKIKSVGQSANSLRAFELTF
jgi:hypothetical protein